jgi:hypothetical protein
LIIAIDVEFDFTMGNVARGSVGRAGSSKSHTSIEGLWDFSIDFWGQGPNLAKSYLLAFGVTNPVERDVNRENESNGKKHKVEEGRNDDCHTSIDGVVSFSIKF